ncbi:hypothetical protein P8452_31830 [Trifolium repens]|nr:hypothetical protein P8452_31830 [Trifolium repens]
MKGRGVGPGGRLNSENLCQHKKHQETPHGTSFSELVNRHPSSNVNLSPLVTSASRKERFVFPEFVSQSSFAEGGPFEELCKLHTCTPYGFLLQDMYQLRSLVYFDNTKLLDKVMENNGYLFLKAILNLKKHGYDKGVLN